MEKIKFLKEQANKLRKEKQFEDAVVIYEQLWESPGCDRFDAAGYLHCLRKLKWIDKALAVARECENKYLGLDWCRNEVIWTYIEEINQIKDTEMVEAFLPIAKKVMHLKPDSLQKKVMIMKILKRAKQSKKWGIASEWVDFIEPETLDDKPIILKGKPIPWNDYLIWHHYKIQCLLHQEKSFEAISLVTSIRSKTVRLDKYFKVLEARAYLQCGQIHIALPILKQLCRNEKADWWVVYDYAKALKSLGEKEVALQQMYSAAARCNRLESGIRLLEDIHLLSIELNKLEEAYYHMALCRLIREKQGWPVSDKLIKLIEVTEKALTLPIKSGFTDVLRECRGFWLIEKENKYGTQQTNTKKSLIGSLIEVKGDKPFCFIKTINKSYFCHVSEIKGEPKEGVQVKFDAVTSFDRKKQQESWKAVNVVVQTGNLSDLKI